MKICLLIIPNNFIKLGSSVARAPPLACKACKIACFWCFWGQFVLKKWKQPPPKGFGCRSCEVVAVIWPEEPCEFPISAEKSVSIAVKTPFFFFWRSPVFGRKNRLNFRFRPKNLSQFQWRPFFFVDHLFLGGKIVWISDYGRKIRLNFG